MRWASLDTCKCLQIKTAIDILPISSYALCICHWVQRVDTVSRSLANALLADTHLNEHRKQPAAELVHAVAGAVMSVYVVCLPVQLQPHSLF